MTKFFIKDKKFKMTEEYYLDIKMLNSNLSQYYLSKTNQYSDDSGIDLYCPEDLVVPAKSLGFMINLGVAAEVYTKKGDWYQSVVTSGRETHVRKNHGYWILPRSSIGKTPLRLSNSVGLVDTGYRGELRAIVDNHSNRDFTIEKGVRLFQIANAQLSPMKVTIVNELTDTTRGDKGFGSTGK